MIRLTKILVLGTAGASLVLSGQVLAQATQGELGEGDGATSTGSTTITVTKQQAIQITQLTDITLASATPVATEALTATDEVCVFSTDDAYVVSATSAGGFLLTGTDGATDTIPYTVTFGGTDLNGGATAAQTGGTTACTDDGSGETTNAQYTVTVAPEAFNDAESGTYTDTLTLTVGFE